jgi:hypothetical protein
MSKKQSKPTTTLTKTGKKPFTVPSNTIEIRGSKPGKVEKVSTQVVVKSLEKQAAPLFTKLSRLGKIKTEEEYNKAYELTKELKELSKEADRQLNTITEPNREIKRQADASIKAAGEIFRPFQNRVADIDATIKAMMGEYQKQLDSKKEKLVESFEKGKISKASTFMRKSVELENSTGVRKIWQAIEKDINKTPDKYWIVDVDKIKADLKDGIEVPGWAWEQVKTIVI